MGFAKKAGVLHTKYQVSKSLSTFDCLFQAGNSWPKL